MLKAKNAKITELLHGERFDVAAQTLFSDMSRKKIKAIIDQGGAYLNKKRILIAKYQVSVGDRIEIFWEENESQNKHRRVTILFENENFLIIDKPAGVASQATLTSQKDTIIHLLCANYPEKYKVNSMILVHRLDKDTSGIMIIAKNNKTQKTLENLFKEKKITKEYTALCYQKPKNMKGEISFPLVKDLNRKNCYFAVTNPHSNAIKSAKSAQTEYVVQKIFTQGEASLISCFPKTGRTHQIRIHLSAIGCPILGDKTYGQNVSGSRFSQIALRHMLHASKIAFTLDGHHFKFESPLPPDFLEIIKKLER